VQDVVAWALSGAPGRRRGLRQAASERCQGALERLACGAGALLVAIIVAGACGPPGDFFCERATLQGRLAAGPFQGGMVSQPVSEAEAK
jgi:hypothetical protein